MTLELDMELSEGKLGQGLTLLFKSTVDLLFTLCCSLFAVQFHIEKGVN